jgi:hypothetical protein
VNGDMHVTQPRVWVHKEGTSVLVRWGQGSLLMLEVSHADEVVAIHPGSTLSDYRIMHQRHTHQSTPAEWLESARRLVDELADRIGTGAPPPASLAGVLPPEDETIGELAERIAAGGMPAHEIAAVLSRLAGLSPAAIGPVPAEQPAAPPPGDPGVTDHPPHDRKSPE